MPREQMDVKQVAAYLHMDPRDVEKLASREKIPARRVGGAFIFTKGEVDHWVETHMHTLERSRLAEIERGVSRHHGFEHEELVTPLIPDGGVAAPLDARTGPKALRALVDLADALGLVYNAEELLAEVQDREALCTTAVLGQVAMPHPRHPLPWDIAESFVVVGLTAGGVPFGALDGGLTRLFFLICCKDDRTHLHVLARLAQMLHDDALVAGLTQSGSADELREKLHEAEQAALERA